MDYVIIGNSAAAVGCVEGIRQKDREGRITIVSKEKYHVYSRPLISYLLCGKTDLNRMKYRPDSFYKDNGCELHLGVSAEKLLPEEKSVLLSDGKKLRYDKLLVAAGSSPFVPRMEGLEQVEKKFTFLSLDDALALEKALTPESRVLIVGAGLIGLKCAEGIRARVASIDVADLADRVLPSVLDAEAAGIVQTYLEKQGLVFHLNNSVKLFSGNKAVLSDGEELPFDILVVAVGVRPNSSLVAEAGGKAERGIATDLCGRTTIPDVYAAGDCAQSRDITTGQNRVLALLPNAYMQGECAGINMAGGEKLYDKAIPMNAVGFFGLHMLSAGSGEGRSYVRKSENSYKELVTGDDRLKRYILIGDVARGGIYTSLIREQMPLSSIDFGLILEKPQLMAFSRGEREKILGGKHDED